MEKSDQDNYVFAGKQKQGNTSIEDLKAKYPRVFSWVKALQYFELSDTGYRNYAARFGMSVEELKQIISEFEKGGNI